MSSTMRIMLFSLHETSRRLAATSNGSPDLLEKTLQNKDIISGLLDSKNLQHPRGLLQAVLVFVDV